MSRQLAESASKRDLGPKSHALVQWMRRSTAALPLSGLAGRFARVLVGLVGLALLASGAVNTWLTYQQATASAMRVQQEKALAAAERVADFIGAIEGQMGWTTGAEWARVAPDQRRYDLIRLMRQSPAILDVTFIDAEGREQIRLSRLEPDMIGNGADLSADPRFMQAIANRVWYGPVYFKRDSEPHMTLSIAHAGRKPSVTSASVNLKLIWDVITDIRVGEAGYAYVTDAAGRLVAHPDMGLVLRGTDLLRLPQVALATGGSAGVSGITSANVAGPDGRAVLSAHAPIPKIGWLVFVELPRREILAPVLATLYQTAAFLGVSVLMAVLLGGWLARRMVVPIRQLQAGAERLGEGDLGQRIPVTSEDEIGALAHRFNVMAARVQEARDTLEDKVTDRTHELARSLDDLRAAQDRLIQTEKLASLGQLTAGVAHEIKNPLNFVNNFADVSADLVHELEAAINAAAPFLKPELRDEVTGLGATLRDNLAKIARHGRRADSIIRKMLAHSREGGGERRAVELNALIEEALSLAYHGARAEKPGFSIVFERALDPAIGQVELYPQEFTRVLLNVFANSFHATHGKGLEGTPGDFQPRLSIATAALHDRIEIRVRDNGHGIPHAVKPHIFQPFFTTKPTGEGTGLGLSLAHDIVVKQHRGTIDVMSEPGFFTEFVITLPRSASPSGGTIT